MAATLRRRISRRKQFSFQRVTSFEWRGDLRNRSESTKDQGDTKSQPLHQKRCYQSALFGVLSLQKQQSITPSRKSRLSPSWLCSTCAPCFSHTPPEIGIGINLRHSRLPLPRARSLSLRSSRLPLTGESSPPAPGANYVWVSGPRLGLGRQHRRRSHWFWVSAATGRPVPTKRRSGLPGTGWLPHAAGSFWVEGAVDDGCAAPPSAPRTSSGPPPRRRNDGARGAASDDRRSRSDRGRDLTSSWVGGHWAWRGGWVWRVAGHYQRHPHYHPGAAWVAGHWDHRGGVYCLGRRAPTAVKNSAGLRLFGGAGFAGRTWRTPMDRMDLHGRKCTAGIPECPCG